MESPVAKVERRPDGRIIAVIGSSRSGKTLWAAQQLRAARRLLVWDFPKREWAQRYRCRAVDNLTQLGELLADPRPQRLAFCRETLHPHEYFEAWAALAFKYAKLYGAPVVAEELSSVTGPGKAPPNWGALCRMGLGYGTDIYAISQRTAESDKTALGNASIVHCGRCMVPRDQQTMAGYMRVRAADIAALQDLEYFERDARGAVRRGRVLTTTRT